MKLTGITGGFRAPRVLRAAAVTASVALCAVSAATATAGASTANPAALAAPAGLATAGIGMPGTAVGLPRHAAAALARSGTSPAAQAIIDTGFSSDSCTSMPDNPSVKSICTAVGTYAGASSVNGLLESSENGNWSGNIFGSLGVITNPVEVSCVPQSATLPVCVAVGDFYGTNPNYPTQLVSTGDVNGFSPAEFSNPPGDSWSVLDDVSCTSASFCMFVGSAGTTRSTSGGLVYLSHATAYYWNGSGMRKMGVPGPARARASQLSAVSCTSSKACMLLGDYVSSAGRTLPYSVLWLNGKWRVQGAPALTSKKYTIFQAVSCVAATSCIAVGDAETPNFKAFAERYVNGRWTIMGAVGGSSSALYGLSCPAQSYCVAAGVAGNRSLIEAWNGRWTVQRVPATAKPLTVDVLFHISCVTPEDCTAVGYRHNPASRYSFQTLALGWNGSSWAIQKTINE